MLKFYTAVLFLLFTPQTQVLELRQVSTVLDSSVLIHSKVWEQDKDTNKIKYGMVGCSGTYIGPNHILTAAHCFSYPSVGTWVKSVDQKSVKAVLIKIDPSLDLAILAVPGEVKHPYARLAKTVRQGEEVINVGSPFSLPFLLSEGIVAQMGIKTKEFKATYLITTAMINSGSSGGGAFNAAGELIGVNTMSIGGMFGWAGISMAVDNITIRKFLN